MSLPASDPPERRRVVIANVTPQVDGGRYAVKRVDRRHSPRRGRRLRRGPRRAHRAAHVPPAGRRQVASRGNEARLRRPLVRRVLRRRHRQLLLHRHGLAGPLPHLAPRPRKARRRRAGRAARARHRRQHDARGRRQRPVRRGQAPQTTRRRHRARRQPAAPARRNRPRRSRAARDARSTRRATRSPSTRRSSASSSTASAPASAPGTSSSRARPRRSPASTAPSRRRSPGCPTSSQMGFDVLYLPPIHPIGATNRKGPNNSPVGAEGDSGSPWAIGGAEGGHKAVHPELGTLADFRGLVEAARGRGMEVALDIAFQCSPDHPYVKEHPEWFKHRPDGTIQYAENPPKKYQDIYPFDFETRRLAGAVGRAARASSASGSSRASRIFRVDNPHTKPFAVLGVADRAHQGRPPGRASSWPRRSRGPSMMEQLAKLGFTQSYTYFTWRNAKWELTRVLDGAHARRRSATTSGPTSGRTRRTSCPSICSTGGRPAFVIRARPGGDAGRQLRHLRPGVRARREPRRASRAARSTSTRRSTRSGTGTSTTPRACSDLIARVNRIRRENAGAAAQRHAAASCASTTTTSSPTSRRLSDGENVVIVRRQPRPAQHAGGTAAGCRWWDAGHRRRTRPTRCTTC